MRRYPEFDLIMATRRRTTGDPPEDYQLSRAALRDRYGARKIDASAPQSARDTTPSGRARYLEQQGSSPVQAEAQVQQEFKAKFPQPAIVPQQQPLAATPVAPPLISRQSRRQPFQGGFASPEDVGMVRQAGGTGTLQTPYGSVTLGLLPQTAPAEELSAFTPVPPTVSPLTGFNLPTIKPTFLGSPLPSRFNRYG